MTPRFRSLVLVIAVALVTPVVHAGGAAPPPAAGSPTKVVSEDIPRFWKAFDASETEGAAAYDRLYLKPGTPGLHDFIEHRIQSAQHLYETVMAHREYYRLLREITLGAPHFEERIQASFAAMKALYPQAKLPDVYFVIGALNSGGTSSDHGLIIGLDMYGKSPTMPTKELNDWMLSVVKPIDEVPFIVAHELIHFEQNYPDSDTLLAASLHEGAADFVGELISGGHINKVAHAYGSEHEAELWREFHEQMNGKSLKGWLYSSSPGRPNDLGYWMGYRIAQSYYDRAPDKKKAVADILNISDYQKFLRDSGYDPN